MVENTPVGNLSKKIVKNTFFNSIGGVWTFIINFVLTPFIVTNIGTERYGVWALVFVVTSYFGLLDFGVGTSYEKYISEYYTKRDYRRLNSVVNTGIVIYSLISIFILIAYFLLIDFVIIHLLKIPAELRAEARFTFLVGVVIFIFYNTFSVFQALIRGLQRMEISNLITILVSIPNAVGIILVLHFRWGLKGLILNRGLIVLLTAGLSILFSIRLFPKLQINPLLFSREIFRKLFGFGVKMQVGKIGNIILQQTNQLILSFFLGLNFVTFFQLGNKIVSALKRFPLFLLSALVPAVSEIDARQDTKTLKKLYHRGSKYLMIVSIPTVIFLLVSAHFLTYVWLGKGFGNTVLAIQILGLAYGLNLITGVGTSIVRGIGKPEYEMRYALITMITSLILSFVWVRIIGYKGVLLAVLFGSLFGTVYFMLTFHKLIEESIWNFVKETCSIPLLYATILSLPLVVLFHFTGRFAVGRIPGLGIILGSAGLFGFIYLFLMIRTDYFDSYDKNIMLRIGKRIPFSKFWMSRISVEN